MMRRAVACHVAGLTCRHSFAWAIGLKKRMRRSFAASLRRRRISHVQQKVANAAAAAMSHMRDGTNRRMTSASAPAPTWKIVRAMFVGRWAAAGAVCG